MSSPTPDLNVSTYTSTRCPCFPRLLTICIASLRVFYHLISYLSEKSRVQLVKVLVVHATRLPQLVMHQTVMAGNCFKKKFILL